MKIRWKNKIVNIYIGGVSTSIGTAESSDMVFFY